MIKFWHKRLSNISPKARIGDGSVIHASVHIHDDVAIGENCKVEAGALLFNGVIIEDDVFIGPGVITTNDKDLGKDFKITKTVIRQGAKIGAGSILVCGITIGNNAVVGAGSLVTKNIPDEELWFGSPAKFVRSLKE